MNNIQVVPSELDFQEDEARYLTNEGLAKTDSYVNQFIQQFWYQENLLFEWDKIQQTRNLDKKLVSSQNTVVRRRRDIDFQSGD